MQNQGGLIRSSARVLRVASCANGAFAAALVAGLATSLALGNRFTIMLLGAGDGMDLGNGTSGVRWILLLGLTMSAAILVMLRALGRVIETMSNGDPFVVDNAARLRAIGWSLLFIQLLDVPAALIARGFPALGSAAPDAGFSPAGWLAVLMIFVLARVFVVGAQMRDDLEGTV